jgi:CHAD domain-containing protein
MSSPAVTPNVPEKWISGFDASQSLAEAARRALKQRLEAVEKLLRPVRRPSMTVDQVHQLRVATRRSSAALRAFERCLKNNTLRRMNRRLKKIRSAAALVRSADVHLMLLGRQLEAASNEDRAPLEHLISFITLERAERARDLARPARKLTKGKFQRRVDKLLESIKDRESVEENPACPTGDSIETFQRAADSSLARMAAELEESLAANLNDPVALHALRLHGKRLRYALEIFAACLAASTRDKLYGELAALQERLGAINDQYELAQRASEAADQLRQALQQNEQDPNATHGLWPELEKLQNSYRLAAEAAHQKFLEWWQSEESIPVRESIARLAGTQLSAEPAPVPEATASEVPQPEVVVVKKTVDAMADAVDADRSNP